MDLKEELDSTVAMKLDKDNLAKNSFALASRRSVNAV